MRLALDAPDRVEKLVLACTAARFGEPEAWHERAATVREHGLEAIADAVLARWFTPGFDDAAAYRDMFLSVDAEGYARCCEALARWDVRDELAGDRRADARDRRRRRSVDASASGGGRRRGIPGARFAVIADAAHLANVERPAEFNRLLEEHL